MEQVDIENLLQIKYTKAKKLIYRQKTSTLDLDEKIKDVYSIKEKFDENTEPSTAFNHLIDKINQISDSLFYLNNRFEVYLKLFIQSDHSQIKFDLSEDMLRKITKLGLELRLSIFSWGMEFDN